MCHLSWYSNVKHRNVSWVCVSDFIPVPHSSLELWYYKQTECTWWSVQAKTLVCISKLCWSVCRWLRGENGGSRHRRKNLPWIVWPFRKYHACICTCGMDMLVILKMLYILSIENGLQQSKKVNTLIQIKGAVRSSNKWEWEKYGIAIAKAFTTPLKRLKSEF